MKLRRFTSVMLIVCLILLTVPMVNAASFPDVLDRHAWAAEAIDSMASRGILKGFPDGTFKPDNSITKLDALIITSRILGYIDPDNQKYIDAALKVYSSDLEPYNFNYKGEVAYLLYRGVITTDELSSYISDSAMSQPLRRHEAAILLTKMMGAEQEVLSSSMVILDYSDEASIPAASKPYVNYVKQAGLMNGMENNMFSPLAEVTRAMMATMMYRAEQAMKETVVNATVVSSSPANKKITIKDESGNTEDVDIPDSVVIKVDAVKGSIVSLMSGVNIRLYYRDDTLEFIEAIASDLQFITYAVVKTTSTNNGARLITVTDPSDTTGESKIYALADNCTFTVDKAFATFNSIQTGMYVKITVKSGSVTSVDADSSETTYNGTVAATTFNDKTSITVTLNDGTTKDLAFNDKSGVTRNGLAAQPTDVAVGDIIEAKVKYGIIETLKATSKNKNISGTIEEIDISSAPKISINAGGTLTVYNVTSQTTFDVDNTEGTIYDLRLGATATITLESNNIKKISTTAIAVSPVLVGKINYIYPTSNVMGIDVVNSTTGKTETIQTVVKSTVKITDTTSTKISQFKYVTVGRNVVVTGTVKYGVFEVATITITE